MTESEIRADERARCYEDLEALAVEYIEKWTPIVGADAAKADAWNVLVAADRMRQMPPSTVNGSP